MAESSD
jgi:hypothetical protein